MIISIGSSSNSEAAAFKYLPSALNGETPLLDSYELVLVQTQFNGGRITKTFSKCVENRAIVRRALERCDDGVNIDLNLYFAALGDTFIPRAGQILTPINNKQTISQNTAAR